MDSPEDLRWWKAADRPHEPLVALFQQIKQRQSPRNEALLRNLRLYGDRRLAGSWSWQWSKPETSIQTMRGPRLSMNVVRSCVDAACAKIGKDRPSPTFLTTGGDWSLQRKARDRGRFVDGLFQKGGLYDTEEPRAMQDMALHGTGAVKVVERFGEVRYERTFLGELWVDDLDAIYGKPRGLYQAQLWDRAVAAELFPRQRNAIRDAAGAPEGFFMRDPRGDQIVLIEGWHLPSGPKAKDGRHVVAVSGATLFDEPWTSQRFPFGFEHWGRDPLGFWGTGLGHLLAGKQYEINQVLHTISENIYLGGNLKVFVERGAKVVKAHLSNDLRGVVVEYNGRPPEFFAGNVVAPELFQHLQAMVRASFEDSGISQLSAQAQIPPAISGSGRSMLVYSNIESERFATVQQSREAMFMDLAELSLEAAARIYERDGKLSVRYRNRSWLEPIDYADIAMDPDDYEVACFPTSILPKTPAGKLAMVEQLMKAGLIDQQRARKLLDFPDLDADEDLETAPIRLVDERIERILERGDAAMAIAHPRMDLAMAKRRALLAYNQAEQAGAPTDRLELLGEFIDNLIDQELAQNAPQNAAVAPEAANVATGAPQMPVGPAMGPPPGPMPPPPMPPPGA